MKHLVPNIVSLLFALSTQNQGHCYLPVPNQNRERTLVDRFPFALNRPLFAASTPSIFALYSSSRQLPVEGLIDDFERLNRIHKVVKELQRQVPRLLSERLTDESASRIYTANTRLCVGESENAIELAASRDELIRVSTALVVVDQASKRAADLLTTFQQAAGASKSATAAGTKIESKIILKWDKRSIDWCSIQVIWKTDVLPLQGNSGLSGSALGKLFGSSRLSLAPDSGKITSHRLEWVQWNDQSLDSRTIGQSLSSLRQTLRNVERSPLGQAFLSASSTSTAFALFSQAQEELLNQGDSSATAEKQEQGLSPIFVSSSDWNKTSRSDREDDDGAFMLSLDDFVSEGRNMTIPILPGSQQWEAYANAHRAVVSFVNDILPSLQSSDVDTSAWKALFVPNVRLLTYDGSVLLQDANRVANFYRSLTVWRQRTFGSWSANRVVVEEMLPKPRIRIDYTTSIQLPGAAPISAKGIDIYTLSVSDGETAPSIEQIQQSKLILGDGYSTQDALWFMRTLATAVETGQWRSQTESETFWLDLLSRVSRRRDGTSSAQNSSRASVSASTPRSDKAALTTYRIMESLHVQGRALVDTSVRAHHAPGGEYVTDNVQLVGPLDAVLVRGSSQYKRSLELAVASLRAGLSSGRILSEKEPGVSVELTAKSNVRTRLTLFLRVTPLGPGGRFPLKFEVESEYMLEPESGRIMQHRLLSTRVNGQLTPVDVLDRWIQRVSGGSPPESDVGLDRTLSDALNWVRSLSS